MSWLISWFSGFAPKQTTVSHKERLRACCGALLGILLTGLISRWAVGSDTLLPMLIAPMGASAVLLFALPSSPLAQPWSIIGGNLVAATVGVTCAIWISNPAWAAALAVAIAIGVMLALRCLHPPSGAVALTAVLGGPLIHAQGYHFLWIPVGINSLVLLGVALLFNNLTGRRYPQAAIESSNTRRTAEQQTRDRLGFRSADLDYVLANYNQVLDVSRADLESLLRKTEMHAYHRRFGEITCADIMSRDVASVEFGTELLHAWELLHQRQVKALPVVDTVNRVIGIITLVNFIEHAELHSFHGYDNKLRNFLQKVGHSHSDKPEVVGQIMSKTVLTVKDDLPIAELVDVISMNRHRHIPVIDHERRLVGIITNSDLIAGLYRGRLAEAAQ